MNILFICSQNRVRSLTAERLFSEVPGLRVSSAGTDIDARRFVTRDMLNRADIVFVMEQSHLDALLDRFGEASRPGLSAKTVVLDIEADLPSTTDLRQVLFDRVREVLPGVIPSNLLRTLSAQAAERASVMA